MSESLDPDSSSEFSSEELSKFELSTDSELETTVFGNNRNPLCYDADRHDRPIDREELGLRPNERIGRYVVIKTLGSGGFGIVYLAQDPKLARKVAIKVSRSLDLLPDKLRTSLVDEARAAASLDHPNIIRVFDVDQWQNRTYVVMELVEGKSLAEVIAMQEAIPLPRVLGIMKQIALALEQLHAKGIIHRDLKPANILITENEQVKVTDLGLALTDESPLWNAKHIAGTQRYMSPEQVLGEVHRIDGRTDIWAFGVVVFEMLTLQSPFRTNDASSVFSKILKGEIASPRQRRPEIPDSLERLCLQCLSKRMTGRFQSAKQLSEAIAKIEAEILSHNASALDRYTPEASNESQLHQTPNHRSASTQESLVTRLEKKSSSTSDFGELRGLVPRGLRAFSAEDSSYYHRLIPGPYDIEGRPAILNHWLKWIENADRNVNQSVGVIYGASGCGKSSFVLASLIPSLPPAIKTIYFNFTVQNPVQSLVQLLHERFPHTKAFSELPHIFGAIRSREEPFKVLFVFDQFEQYLINTHIDLEHVLVQAIRQCDGEKIQAIILVRDEFWTEISQFMQIMESSLLDGINASNHPLMNKVHARRVLESFGRAYEMLPAFDLELTASQRMFIDTAIDGLAKDESVLCVRIAMFAEMMRNYPWEIQTIVGFGGADGAVIRFLTDAFHSQNSPMSRRSVASNCMEVLRALLPQDDRELKSAAKSISELASSANEDKESVRFTQAIRCLEVDLRIISATSTVHSFEQQFSLAHDYLVRPIQNWLADQDNSSWQGRARQRLSMMANRFHRDPSRVNILGIWDWLVITIAVSKTRRTEEQNRVMRVSGRRAFVWLSVFAVGLTLLATLGVSARMSSIQALENEKIAVNYKLFSFLAANSKDLQTAWRRLEESHFIAKKEIEGLQGIKDVDQQRRQVQLKALLGANVAFEDIDRAVSESDIVELDLWREYLSNSANRNRTLSFLQTRKASNASPQWHWLFLVRNDYQLLNQIEDAFDPGVEMYKLLAFAAQDFPPYLDEQVRANMANELIQAGQTQKATYHTRMCLATHLIGMDDFQKDLVPKPLLDYLERTRSDTDRNKAMTAQWFLSKFESKPVIAPPSKSNHEWRMDEPIPGMPFAMIHLPEGAVSYEIASPKGKKQFGIVMSDNVWMARQEISHGLVNAFFREFPKFQDFDWPSEVSDELGASNIVAPTVLHFCNWLSDKAGLEKVYVFDTNKKAAQQINNFSEISMNVHAQGYRLPTFDELRYAGINGDFASFWTTIATEGMMVRINPAPQLTRPTYAVYPNAWGFQGVTGNLTEMVVDNEWNICLAATGSKIQLWNNAVPFQGEASSKNRIAGFRVVQGATEN